jgi:hypothetical protein
MTGHRARASPGVAAARQRWPPVAAEMALPDPWTGGSAGQRAARRVGPVVAEPRSPYSLGRSGRRWGRPGAARRRRPASGSSVAGRTTAAGGVGTSRGRGTRSPTVVSLAPAVAFLRRGVHPTAMAVSRRAEQAVSRRVGAAVSRRVGSDCLPGRTAWKGRGRGRRQSERSGRRAATRRGQGRPATAPSPPPGRRDGEGAVPVGEGAVPVGEGMVPVGEGMVPVGEGMVPVGWAGPARVRRPVRRGARRRLARCSAQVRRTRTDGPAVPPVPPEPPWPPPARSGRRSLRQRLGAGPIRAGPTLDVRSTARPDPPSGLGARRGRP